MLPQVTGEFVMVFDPDLRFSAEGKPWAKMRLVAKDRKKNESGEWVDADTCFIDAVAYGREAENIAESVSKGDLVVIMGKLLMREWTADDGRKMSGYSILVDKIGPSLRMGASKSRRMTEDQAAAAERARPAVDDPYDGAPF